MTDAEFRTFFIVCGIAGLLIGLVSGVADWSRDTTTWVGVGFLFALGVAYLAVGRSDRPQKR